MVTQRWAKTEGPEEKPDVAELGFLTCTPAETHSSERHTILGITLLATGPQKPKCPFNNIRGGRQTIKKRLKKKEQ